MAEDKNDIEQSLSGKLSSRQQHALEKKALSDPFLAEALEGAGSIPPGDFSADLQELSKKIKHQKKTVWMWPMGIAAGLALIVLAYFFTGSPLNEKSEDLALKKPATEQPAEEKSPVASDTVIQKNDATLSDQAALQPKPNPDKGRAREKKIETLAPSGGSIAVIEKKEEKEEKKEEPEDLVADLVEEEKEAEVKPAEVQEAKRKAEEPAPARSLAQGFLSEQKVLQGKVSSAEDGTPLPGVNVIIKGTAIGTVTDMNGEYELISTIKNPQLVYSFIGLQTQEVQIKDQKEINISLQSDVSQLSEVVVVGYGAQKNPNHEPIVKLAEPLGGKRAYDKYLKTELRYPQQALDNGIKGRVTVQFTVRTDGSLDEFNVLKSLGYGCDEEVIRLVKEGAKWSPTTEDTVPVESEVRVKVKFSPPN